MRLLILHIILIFFLLSCEKENAISPNDLLKGKWRIILLGNKGDIRPYETQWIYEYYNDSLLSEYDTLTKAYTFHAKYTIDKEFLIHYFNYPEDTLIFKYSYEFFDNYQKLEIIHQNLISTYSTRIYERVQ